mgnify:CR=1 FL=1|jgi:hypothetical protein
MSKFWLGMVIVSSVMTGFMLAVLMFQTLTIFGGGR